MLKRFSKFFNHKESVVSHGEDERFQKLIENLTTINNELDMIKNSNLPFKTLFKHLEDVFSKVNRKDPLKKIIENVIREFYLNLDSTQVWFIKAVFSEGKLYGTFDFTIGLNSGELQIGHIFDIESNLPTYKYKLKNGHVVIVTLDHINNFDKQFLSMWPIKSLVLIPILDNGKMWGCIGIVNHNKFKHWTNLEKRFFSLLSKLFSIYITLYLATVNINEKDAIMNDLDTGVTIYSWRKDNEGRYLYVDEKWTKIFYPSIWKHMSLIGETDMGAITYFRKLQGNSHTFGELCIGSDQLCIEARKEEHFLEVGAINGKPLLLHVIKKPHFDSEGKLIDIIGIAHDITFIGLDTFNKIIEKDLGDQLIIIKKSDDPLILVYQFKDVSFSKFLLWNWYIFK